MENTFLESQATSRLAEELLHGADACKQYALTITYAYRDLFEGCETSCTVTRIPTATRYAYASDACAILKVGTDLDYQADRRVLSCTVGGSVCYTEVCVPPKFKCEYPHGNLLMSESKGVLRLSTFVFSHETVWGAVREALALLDHDPSEMQDLIGRLLSLTTTSP